VYAPVCAICVDRTRGQTQRLQLPTASRCGSRHDHASPAFRTRRSGRDFATTLAAVWKGNDCLTIARSKALAAHLESQRRPKPPRPRPGSYAWPDLRRAIEAGCAAGATPGEIAPAVPPHHPALARPAPVAGESP